MSETETGFISSSGHPEVTVAVRDHENPIGGIIEAILKDTHRKQKILDSGNPKQAIENIKKGIVTQKVGPLWHYQCYVPAFFMKFKCITGTRLAEDMSYNPFK